MGKVISITMPIVTAIVTLSAQTPW
jgi:hypothetical protein